MNKKIFKIEQKDLDFFELYDNKVNVIGFKPSWVSEIKNDMKESYESKLKESHQKAKSEKR